MLGVWPCILCIRLRKSLGGVQVQVRTCVPCVGLCGHDEGTEIVWDYPAGFGGVAGILIRGRQEEQNQRQESREGATLGRGGRGYRSEREADFPQSL